MKTKLNFLCVVLIVLAFFFSSCSSVGSTSSKVGAAVGLPFALVGDSVLFPFQFIGHISLGLLSTGEAYDLRYSEQWDFTEYPDEGFGFIFSIPGYIISPFAPLAQLKYFGLTSYCVDTLTYKNIAYRRRRISY